MSAHKLPGIAAVSLFQIEKNETIQIKKKIFFLFALILNIKCDKINLMKKNGD